MSLAFQVAPRPIYHSEKPVRDRAYRHFVCKQPCSDCHSTRGIHAAHTGPHGLGQKASDLSTIPLCFRCHPRYDRNPRGFAKEHGMNIRALVRMLNRRYGHQNAEDAVVQSHASRSK